MRFNGALDFLLPDAGTWLREQNEGICQTPV